MEWKHLKKGQVASFQSHAPHSARRPRWNVAGFTQEGNSQDIFVGPSASSSHGEEGRSSWKRSVRLKRNTALVTAECADAYRVLSDCGLSRRSASR